MTTAAHAPGPWQHGYNGTTGLWVGPVLDKQPVAIVPWDTDDARDTARADARLIAAAPDLLAACVALVDSFEKHRPKELWDAARAAIARATGAA
jgi:hypothetical protein